MANNTHTILNVGAKTTLWSFINIVRKQLRFDDVISKTLLKSLVSKRITYFSYRFPVTTVQQIAVDNDMAELQSASLFTLYAAQCSQV